MKTLPLVIAVLLITLSLFMPQKKAAVDGNLKKHDTVIIKQTKSDGQKTVLTPIATELNIASLMKEKQAVVFHYGIAPYYNPEFEKKYGVKIVNQGCVMISGERDSYKTNNQAVAQFLTEKFGDVWKKDLGFALF